MTSRADGRALDQLREARFTRGWLGQDEGSVLVEFGALGTLSALLAVGAAAAIGVAVSQKVFELPLLPPWPGLLIGGVVGIGLSLLAGWWGTRAILHTPPALALREA